jgi:benzoyl-CoA-dihydrodiol lyase
MAYDALLEREHADWLIREVVLLWKRTLKRLDATSRTLIALAEPGSCFAGFLAELLLAADRHYMLDGVAAGDNREPAAVTLSASNFGPLPAANGLARLETRFLGELERFQTARARIGEALDAAAAAEAGLATEAFDEIDWDDEIRIIVEERASFSPDALTGLHANLRCAGPETMETRILGRLSAWQNWIFQRPSATGEHGALGRYGTGVKPSFDRKWV